MSATVSDGVLAASSQASAPLSGHTHSSPCCTCAHPRMKISSENEQNIYFGNAHSCVSCGPDMASAYHCAGSPEKEMSVSESGCSALWSVLPWDHLPGDCRCTVPPGLPQSPNHDIGRTVAHPELAPRSRVQICISRTDLSVRALTKSMLA